MQSEVNLNPNCTSRGPTDVEVTFPKFPSSTEVFGALNTGWLNAFLASCNVTNREPEWGEPPASNPRDKRTGSLGVPVVSTNFKARLFDLPLVAINPFGKT